MPHDGDGTSAACSNPSGTRMKPVCNTPGPATGKQASELISRRVAARPGEMPDGQGGPGS